MNAHRPTLLVVDDEPEVLRSVHDLFRLDYRVLTFERASGALRAIEENTPSVILTDQRMPEMTGVEFLHHVKRIRPETTRLLFTGYADIDAVIAAVNEGSIFRYIAKPWDPDELASIVRQGVDQHNLLVERKRLIAELRESNAQLLEANRLKGAFIEVASHELNTPVSVVMGMTELWKLTQGEHASPTERAWVDRIQSAGRRLADTVQRMLKLLHADQLDHTIELREVELEPLVRRVVGELGVYLEARRQEVEIQIAPGLGAAEVDPDKIGDILANLIINAIKFTRDGGRIIVGAAPEGIDRVRFRVSDVGVGIAAAEQAHLFEPFFTGYDTMHHSSGEYQYGKRGIGLGLCLVKTFVELHGGTVDVVSAPDEGSTFSFTIPRRTTRHKAARAS